MGEPGWELLKRSVWLACLFSEVALLLVARASLARIERDPRSQGPALALCAFLAVLLAALVLGGDPLFGARLDAAAGHRREGFRWATWNLVATLFVVVEQVILVYLLRLDGLLRDNALRRIGPGGVRILGALLGLAIFGLYAFYLHQLVRVVDGHGLGKWEIQNVSAFYCRVCCALCVLLEWLLAVLAVRAWRTCRERKLHPDQIAVARVPVPVDRWPCSEQKGQ